MASIRIRLVRRWFTLIVLGAAFLPGCRAPVDGRGAVEPPATPEALSGLPDDVTVVQHEMRVLHFAMGNVLTHIANGDLEAIPAEIERVHPARQLTTKAVEAGQYELPRNAEQMQAFLTLDDAFHEDLKSLLGAARADDAQRAATAYGKLVQACVSCHATFRPED